MSQASDDFIGAVHDFTEAMRATASGPGDAIRILSGLLARPMDLAGAPLPTAAAAAFRRAALGSIALACAEYKPQTASEARRLSAQVAGLLDQEMLAAADAGQSASYAALREARAAVIEDLAARAGALPDLVTVTIPGGLPSLAMAYRLYGDARREPGMVARADVSHPGFMPPRFEALSR